VAVLVLEVAVPVLEVLGLAVLGLQQLAVHLVVVLGLLELLVVLVLSMGLVMDASRIAVLL